MPTCTTCKALRALTLAIAFAMLPLVCEAKIFLLSVGISDYPGTQCDLRLPYNDAATIQWVYQQNRHASTRLLVNSQAKLATVKSALRSMATAATAGDIVVMFFSGHGIKGGFVCYDGVLSYDDIYTALATCKSRNKMVFADACYSGAMRRNSRTGASRGRINRNGSVMLFLSCRSNEVSIEMPSMTNGFFTYALQHGLRGSADYNHDRTITAIELFNYVSKTVRQESGNRQHPVMWGRFPRNMAVMRW